MNNPTRKTSSQWVLLALEPSGPDSPSLLPDFLVQLMDKGLIKPDELRAPSPKGIEADLVIDYWGDPEERWGIHRKRESIPVWAHWVLASGREKKKAAQLLDGYLDPHEWVKPFWRDVIGLEILGKFNPDVLDSVLGRLDGQTLEQIKNRPLDGRSDIHLHGQGDKQTMEVLLKHGWDVHRTDAKGRTPIETMRRDSLFLVLLENGADLDIARRCVDNVAKTAKDKQRLLKIIDEKKVLERPVPPEPWRKDHDNLTAIIESGVSGGFAARIKKLHENHPDAPKQGLRVLGGSLGAGMLAMSFKMSKGSRVAGKTRSYFSLCEEILKYNGKGWVDLDAPLEGEGMPQGLTNLDGLMMGAFIMLTSEIKNRTYNTPAPPVYPRRKGNLEQALAGWIPDNLSRVSRAISRLVDMKFDGYTVYHWSAEDTFNTVFLWDLAGSSGNTHVGQAVARWKDNLHAHDPLLLAIRDDERYNTAGGAEIEAEGRHLPITEFKTAREATELWPEMFCKTLESLDGLDDEWIQKIGKQFRTAATHIIFHNTRRSFKADSHDQFRSLEWVADPQFMQRDSVAWTQWSNELHEARIPLVKIPQDLLDDEETVRQNELDLIIGEWEGEEFEEKRINPPEEILREKIPLMDLLSERRQKYRRGKQAESMALIRKALLMAMTVDLEHSPEQTNRTMKM